MTLRRSLTVISVFTLLLAGAAWVVNGVSGPQTADAAGTLPSGWPSTLQIGIADSPGGAASAKAVAPYGFRYQYLAGGVNTGNGWANWNSNGQFATYYIQDSVANGITPVFTYYQIFQSSPGATSGEQSARDFEPLEHCDDDRLLERPEALLPARRRISEQSRRSPC